MCAPSTVTMKSVYHFKDAISKFSTEGDICGLGDYLDIVNNNIASFESKSYVECFTTL